VSDFLPFMIDADLRRAVGHGGGDDRALIAQVKRAVALGRSSLRTQGVDAIAEPDPERGPRWRLAAPRLGRGCFHDGCAPTPAQEQGGTHWCVLAK
jgi:hypothetical protein